MYRASSSPKKGGHTAVDLMANCDACEASDISTVLIDNEWLGAEGNSNLPVLCTTPNADAVISIGNFEEVVELDPIDKVIGGNGMNEVNGDLTKGGKIPVRLIPEAISQLGAGRLKAEANGHEGIKRNMDCGVQASKRAADMLLKKMSGIPWQSEIRLIDST